MNGFAGGARRPDGPLAGVKDDSGPVLAIASLTIDPQRRRRRSAAGDAPDRDRALRAAARRDRGRRPVRAGLDESARPDRRADADGGREAAVIRMTTDAANGHRTWRYWARIGAVIVAASIVVLLGFSGVTWRTPWRAGWPRRLASRCCSRASSRRCSRSSCRGSRARSGAGSHFRSTGWCSWATMVGLATAGSFLAILVLAAVGYLEGAGIIATWMAGSLKISILITLTFGIFTTVLESMRSRLNEATVALRTKERDEAEARRLTAEAQLASIESRVQPHFLFNTLNSIAALVHDDPAGAERMTGQLAALLRSALDSTATPLVTLDDELRVVRAYLDIERVRFGDRLRYSVELGEERGPALVPRMALQTLVENSVKYAVSPRPRGGSIVVRASQRRRPRPRLGRRRRPGVRPDASAGRPRAGAAGRPAGHALRRPRVAAIEATAGPTTVTIDVPSGVQEVGCDEIRDSCQSREPAGVGA